MLCEDTRDYLLDFMDNELPVTLQQEVAQHLRSCADCQEDLESLRKTTLLLQLRGVPEPEEKYWEQAWARIKERSQARVLNLSSVRILHYSLWQRLHGFDWRPALAVAALFVLAIAGALLSRRAPEPEPLAQELIPYAQTMAQPAAYLEAQYQEELQRQIELITMSRVAAGSIDPISKSAFLVRMEELPR